MKNKTPLVIQTSGVQSRWEREGGKNVCRSPSCFANMKKQIKQRMRYNKCLVAYMNYSNGVIKRGKS